MFSRPPSRLHFRSGRSFAFVCLAVAFVAGCEKKESQTVSLPTATVTRGDIAVRVQATGSVEPINPVDIKSKAGGAITSLPVDVGSAVKAHQVLAQIDPRDVKNKFDQAVADDVVSLAGLQQAIKDQARKDTLYARKVITV